MFYFFIKTVESNDSSTNELSLLQSYFYNESALMSRLFFLLHLMVLNPQRGSLKGTPGVSNVGVNQLKITIS